MQDAGLTSTLADTTTKATVFAPTDNAFSNLLAAIGLTAAQLLADPSTLSEVRAVQGAGFAPRNACCMVCSTMSEDLKLMV